MHIPAYPDVQGQLGLGLTLGWEVLGVPCTIRRTGFQGSPPTLNEQKKAVGLEAG